MREFLKRYYKNTGTDLFGLLVAVIVLFFYIIYRNVFPENEYTTVNDYSIKPVHWVKEEYGNRYMYRLQRDTGSELVLMCHNRKLVIQSLSALSIIRLIDKDKNVIALTTMILDGVLFKVPVINNNPNPTKEQIIFLRALSKANTITFIVDDVKYTWSTDNQTELSSCVDLNQDVE